MQGGRAVVTKTLFAGNEATDRGGAIHNDGGELLLCNTTRLFKNVAGTGSAYFNNVSAGSMLYRLPAPLGRWAFIQNVGGLESDMGEYSNEDYPFACSPGVYGKTYRPATQSSPVCEKVCPAGFECAGATIEPVPCSLGSYCPLGSPSGVPCPEGFEGAQRGLKDASECSECPPGHWCTSGKRIQCAEGRYTNSSPAAPLRTDITSCLVCGHAARVLEPRPNPGRARAPELPRTSAPHRGAGGIGRATWHRMASPSASAPQATSTTGRTP